MANKVMEIWKRSTVGRSTKVLSKVDQRKIITITFTQVFLGVLDLLGVITIGLLGALAVSGVQSGRPGGRVNSVLTLLHLESNAFQVQAAIVGLIAAILLVGRTIVSIIITRKTMFYLGRKSAVISGNLISNLLSKSILTIQERTTQQTLYAVTYGVDTILLRIIGASITLVADLSLLIIMSVGLFFVDPVIAFSTLAVFLLIGIFLYKFMHVRSRELGTNFAKIAVVSSEKIIEVLSSYRETVVRNRRAQYANEIKNLQLNLADTTAEMAFMPSISKYVIETTVVLGCLIVSATQFLLQDAIHAVSTLAVFFAAATRIAPAVLRVQQATVTIKGNLGIATPTLDLIESLDESYIDQNVSNALDFKHEGFTGSISIVGLAFKYPEKEFAAVENVSLEIEAGKTVAFVGPSGAGKTTLVDLILGVLNPDKGSVKISGVSPLKAFSRWQGAVSYVPQNIAIRNGTVRENITLGFPIDIASDELLWDALRIAHLDDFVKGLPNGLDSEVGEGGAKISGGQRQRLGIARAMFTKPLLLVLDEATSSLDSETEFNISDSINSLRGSTTVLLIAHRLSTVRNSDLVVYLADGKVLSVGTFEEVKSSVPEFKTQAGLSGL